MTTKIQLLIDEKIKIEGEKIAKKEGFGSFQALLNYWTVQAAKGNLHINNDSQLRETVSNEEIKALNKNNPEVFAL